MGEKMPYVGKPIPGVERLPQTVGEFVVTLGHDQRGKYFEDFLARIGKTETELILGDLGGLGTKGIGAQFAGAEQMAVRSQRLADLLTEQLPGRAAITPDVPKVPQAATPEPVIPHAANENEPLGRGGKRAAAEKPAPVDQPVMEPAAKPSGAAAKEVVAGEVAEAAKTGKAKAAEPEGERTDRPKGGAGRAELDPDAAARAAADVKRVKRELFELETEEAFAQARFGEREATRKLVRSQRPECPPELEKQILKMRREAEGEVAATRDPAARSIEFAEKQLEFIEDRLTDPTLSPEARRFLEWEQKRQGLAFQERKDDRLLAEAPQRKKELRDVEIPAAEAAERKARQGVKDLLEERGDNYKSMKKKAKFDAVMGEERFNAENKARQLKDLPTMELSPDHIFPLAKIAVLKELGPLLAMYKKAPQPLRYEMEAFLRNLGDFKENLMPMHSEANEKLKSDRLWSDISAQEAALYGYTDPNDLVRMVEQQTIAREKIILKINEKVAEFEITMTSLQSNNRRSLRGP